MEGMESRIPGVNTHFRLPPIMLASSPSTSRTTSSTVSGGSMERKRPAKRQAWRRSHSSSTAPFQSPVRWRADVKRSPLGNQGVPHSATCRLIMVSNTDSTICASAPVRVSVLNSVGIGFLSAGDVDGRASHGLSFKPLLDAEGRLGAAEQQPAASKQRAMEFLQDFLPGRSVEVNKDIAAEHQIEGSEGAHALAQVNGLKTGHATHRLAQLPVHAGTAEILDQEGRRQTAVHLNLLVLTGPGAFQDLRGKVGAQDLNVPVTERVVQEKHGQAVSFLPGGRGSRPEPQFSGFPPGFLQPGQ